MKNELLSQQSIINVDNINLLCGDDEVVSLIRLYITFLERFSHFLVCLPMVRPCRWMITTSRTPSSSTAFTFSVEKLDYTNVLSKLVLRFVSKSQFSTISRAQRDSSSVAYALVNGWLPIENTS